MFDTQGQGMVKQGCAGVRPLAMKLYRPSNTQKWMRLAHFQVVLSWP